MGLQIETVDPRAFLRNKRLVLADGVVVLKGNAPGIEPGVAVVAAFLLPMLGEETLDGERLLGGLTSCVRKRRHVGGRIGDIISEDGFAQPHSSVNRMRC